MTDRMSADDFRKQFGKPTKKTLLGGEPGIVWTASCGHEGWSPRVPDACPECGEGKITGGNYKRATAKQAEEWERRNA